MTRTVRIGDATLHLGDCRDIIPRLGKIDACVTDPPYHLTSIVKRFGGTKAAPAQHGTDGAFARSARGFMGKQWDGGDVAFRPETWAAVLRVLKPGGYMVAFASTRGYHRMVCAIEDAGFVIHPMLGWIFGCLDEKTELVSKTGGVKPYHKSIVGEDVLCYDKDTGEYSYQPILEIVEYDYDDTAFRLIGDFGEQVVSRNHRCIVERDGVEVFVLAEEAALEREARIPVLENLPELQSALRDQEPEGLPPGCLRPGMQGPTSFQGPGGPFNAAGGPEGADRPMRVLRQGDMEAGCVDTESQDPRLQLQMQRGVPGRGMEGARAQGAQELDANEREGTCNPHDGRNKPGVERRPDLSQAEGCLCGSANQVCALPGSVPDDGATGRLRDGTPACRGPGDLPSALADGSGASQEPQGDREPAGEPDAVRDERETQGIRAWRGHGTAVVRIVPFRHVGKVWCLRVPTGAFVAVRDGVAFPTGNSGFPKAKRIEASGADGFRYGLQSLKPALEPICLAQKPLEGTGTANWLAHGVGGLNIDGCRIGSDDSVPVFHQSGGRKFEQAQTQPNRKTTQIGTHTLGRWPANLCHDGSPEVLAAFPETTTGSIKAGSPYNHSGCNTMGAASGVKGEFAGDTGSAARFFYQAKADADDRAGSDHPTVKPLALMRWLCRLACPPGGTVLDPFMGTGSTLEAACLEGFHSIGIEREEGYFSDAVRRLGRASGADTPLFTQSPPRGTPA